MNHDTDAIPNLELELKNSEYIRRRVQDDVYAQNLYAAMCNMRWRKLEIWPLIKGLLWGTSWRGAGRIISELRGQGTYIDWYCSGMIHDYDDERKSGYVGEGTVTNEIQQDMRALGWAPVEYPD